MPDMISVLVVDDNTMFCDILCDCIDKAGDMKVGGIAGSGAKAIEMIKTLKPDVVVLDIVMPEIDGIGVLESMQDVRQDKRPVFIVLSAMDKELVINKAIELGADYYVIKPFDIEMLIKHIRLLHAEKKTMRKTKRRNLGKKVFPEQEAEENHMEKVIAGLIKRIGITPNVAGYRYLREAVALAVNQPALLNSVVKLIYPVLAERHRTTEKSIDKAIQCAIDGAYKRMKNAGILDTYIADQYGVLPADCKKPGSARLIALLAERARQLKQ